MKNFKFFSRIFCILVLVFLLSFNTFAMSVSDFVPIDENITEDNHLYSASPSADDNGYWFYGSSDFGFDDRILNSDRFLYYEDLPYGTNTLVCGFRKEGKAIYLIFLDANTTNIILTYYKNGRCAVRVSSLSPIYRIAYSLTNGSVISFASYTGLTDKGTLQDDNPNLNDYWVFDYTFIEGDFRATVTDNLYLNSAYVTQNYNDDTLYDAITDLAVKIGTYPSWTDRTIDIQKDTLDTSKGIWESIKSLPDTITDKLKGLFVPDEGFFSEYFNRLQTFFSEKLGFLVYPFDFIVTFLQKYLDIGEGDGTLHLPDFEIMNVKIFNQTDFNLKNSMSSFLGEYYGIYFAFVDFIILVGLVNLALKKFNSISGGGNE